MLNLYRKDRKALDSTEKFGNLTRIYSDSIFAPSTELNLLHNIKRVHNHITPVEDRSGITYEQFANVLLVIDKEGDVQEQSFEELFKSFLTEEKTKLGFFDFCTILNKVYLTSKGISENVDDIAKANLEFPKFIADVLTKLEALNA